MQAKKPYISTSLRHIFSIVSSQISTMMEPSNAILEQEPTNRRYDISPRDISFLSMQLAWAWHFLESIIQVIL